MSGDTHCTNISKHSFKVLNKMQALKIGPFGFKPYTKRLAAIG